MTGRCILSCVVLLMAGSTAGGCSSGGESSRGGSSDSEGGTSSVGSTGISTTITVGGSASAPSSGSTAAESVDSTGAAETSDLTSGGTTAALDDTSGSGTSGSGTSGGESDESSGDGSSTSTTGVAPLSIDDLVEGDLVITEVMYNPAFCTDANCEWIEIYNASGSAVDLLGLTILDIGASSGEIEDSAVLGAEQYGVLAAGNAGSWGYTFSPLAYYGSSGPFFSQDEGDLVEVANAATTIDIMLYTANGDVNAGASVELDPAIL
ncbi:MAG: lamin tail domain-containing protein, partial [Nannocystaceae bacterium]|nr:lamin tail domain-containing protein [Nannocystaceae bacterium]